MPEVLNVDELAMAPPSNSAAGATKAEVAAEVLGSKLARKHAELRALEDKILHLSDDIQLKSRNLKARRSSEKSLRVAGNRIASHLKQYETDLRNRPSDRGDDIRQYTKADLDIWQYPQVRDWYNKNASSEDFGYHLTPAETGYMIRVESDYVEAHHR